MTPPAPARVFGYVASDADVCVLLRRGPSDWVLMVRWDLRTDEFAIGQWLKARVYERACDLSPDGQLFAVQALISKGSFDRRGQFSTISRPPYFSALAYWPQSTISPSFAWTRPAGKLLPRKAPPPQRGELPPRRTLYEAGREPSALLIAREGRIFVREGSDERELIDLNPFEFRPLAPPKWATRWPD